MQCHHSTQLISHLQAGFGGPRVQHGEDLIFWKVGRLYGSLELAQREIELTGAEKSLSLFTATDGCLWH